MAEDPNNGKVGASGQLDVEVIRKDGTVEKPSFLSQFWKWLKQ